MKLKEIPLSIFTSLKLSFTSIEAVDLKNKKELPIIVSLTSIPNRLSTCHLTIKSILNQSVRPKKIVLWLHNSLKDHIPKQLGILEGEFFEIRYSNLTCSHRKLIHSIGLFPNDIIVTCDDDMMYRRNWLQLLFKEHLKNSKSIIANQTRYIQYRENGDLLAYNLWTYRADEPFNKNAVLPIGAEGILYPPHALSHITADSGLFLKLAPKADDLWFKAMSFLKGTTSMAAKSKPKSSVPILRTQKYALKKTNISDDKNTEQWLGLTAHFNIQPKLFLY